MKKWFKLMLSILVIYSFIELMPRVLENIDIYQKIQDSSASYGIDNNTIFYSEEPISYKAEQSLKDKLIGASGIKKNSD